MNIIKLCQRLNLMGKDLVYDEIGNLYLELNRLDVTRGYHNSDILWCIEDLGIELENYSVIPVDTLNKLNSIDIILSDEFLDWESFARRPYYKIRGRKVTPDQAFEIIRRMDEAFEHNNYELEDHVYSYILRTEVLKGNKSHKYSDDYSFTWIYPDGTIGSTSITSKYPNIMDFLITAFRLAVNFDYLDIVIAVTNWDESPYDEIRYEKFHNPTLEQFLGAVNIGIKISNKTITVLNSFDAQSAYREYNKLYPFENKYIDLDNSYIEKLFQANGLSIEKAQKFIKEQQKSRLKYGDI